MLKQTFTALLFVLLLAQSAFAGGYNYISASDTASAIQQKADIVIVDTRKKASFDKEHLKGAVPVYSYPTNSPEKKALLDKALEKSGPNSRFIIICEGGISARNAVDYFRDEKGIDEKRLLILKGGQQGWPRTELKDVLVTQ